MKPFLIILNILFWGIVFSLIFWYLPLNNLNQVISSDPVISRAEPYLDEIILEDIDLRNKAIEITKNCLSGNKECQINKIYQHIIKDCNYYSDPRKEEFIQTPFETLQLGGGDCEDLTILLNSLLENIGIETYLVLTDDHAYSLVCDVGIEKLQEEIISSSNVEQNLYDERISLDSYSAKYYGGNGEKTDVPFEIKYEIESDNAIDVLVVSSSESLERWAKGESYNYFSSCSNENIYRVSENCVIDQYGGILVINEGGEDASVNIKVDTMYLAFDLATFSTTCYEIDNKTCVVLDATAGEYGYPGYDGDSKGEKIAINSLTKEYYTLK